MATQIIAPATAQATATITSNSSGSVTIQIDTPNGVPANRRNVVGVYAVDTVGDTLADYLSCAGPKKVLTLWGVGSYKIIKYATDVAVGVSTQ